MKALELLKWHDEMGVEAINGVNLVEAIAELETMRTCEGCIHKPKDGENYLDPCSECSRWYSDHYTKVLHDN